MASVGYSKLGSSGNAVSEIQKLLNQNGYNLATDGIYGSQTEAAIRDYQTKYGLQIDGVTGNQTLSSLWSTASASTDPNSGGTTTSNPAAVGGNYSVDYPDWLTQNQNSRPTYTQSQSVTDALNQLTQYQATKPGDYSSKYQDQINAQLDAILNRDAFQYDLLADPTYQQYSEQYQNLGQRAMLDTVGNAAALSGGYGNSYAQTAGQQSYQQHLQELNNIAPALQQAAYGRYQDEGANMRADLGMLQGADATDYGRHQDSVADYYNMLNYYYGMYRDAYSDDYTQHRDTVSGWENDRNYWYNNYRDDQGQSNWQAEYDRALSNDALGASQWDQSFAYQQQQDALAQSNYEREFALAKAGKSSGGSSGKASSGASEKVSLGTEYDLVASKLSQQGSPYSQLQYLKNAVNSGLISQTGADYLVYSSPALSAYVNEQTTEHAMTRGEFEYRYGDNSGMTYEEYLRKYSQ